MNLLQKKGFVNWMVLATSTAASALVNFFVFVVMGRKMSIDDYAHFSTIIALGSTVATFINNVASGTVVNREIAIAPHDSGILIRKAFNIRMLVFLVTMVGLYCYCIFKSEYSPIIAICVIGLLSYEVFYEFFEQVAFGYKETKYSSIISIIAVLVLLFSVIIIPNRYFKLELILVVYTIIYIAKYVVYYGFDKRLFVNTNTGTNVTYLSIIKPSSSYLWMRLVGVLGTQVPILLLDGYSESMEVSSYSVGNKFTLPMTILVNTGIKAFFPYFTKYYQSNRDKYRSIIFLLLGGATMASSILATILAGTCSWWLPLIMGEKYLDAVEPFKYQVWYTCVLCIDIVISMALSTAYKHKSLAVITTIDAVVLLPFLMKSIEFGAIGVSIAKLIAAMICLVYHIIFLIKVIKPIRRDVLMMIVQTLFLIVCFLVSNSYMKTEIQVVTILIIIICEVLMPASPLRGMLQLIMSKEGNDKNENRSIDSEKK